MSGFEAMAQGAPDPFFPDQRRPDDRGWVDLAPVPADLSRLVRCACGAYATVEGPEGEDWCDACAQRVARRVLFGDGLAEPRHTGMRHKRGVKAKRKRERAARRQNRRQR